MSRLERAIETLVSIERTAAGGSPLHRVDARAKLLVTLCFLIGVLRLGADGVPRLLLCLTVPMALCAWGGIPYTRVFVRSLVVLPFVALVGLFNPWIEREVAFRIGGVAVSVGWLSFAAILLRGVVAAQMALVLVLSTGFSRLSVGLRQMGVPEVLASQLLFVHRYLLVLLQEALSMERARASRSHGRRAYPLKLWGTFVGQLLLRTVERSERIHRAMLSRGFRGTMPLAVRPAWHWRDTGFLAAGLAAVILLT